MIQYELKLEEEEQNVFKELTLESEAYMRQLKKGKITFSILGVVFAVFAGVHCFWFSEKAIAIIFFLFTVFCFWYGFLALRMIQKRLIHRAMKRMDPKLISGSRRYIFEADGIQIFSSMGEGKYKWNAFKSWGMHGHYLYMKRADGQVILVDKEELSKEEMAELKKLLAQVWKKE